VLRVNTQDSTDGTLARRYRVSGVPTYLVIGTDGGILHRKTYGLPDSEAVKAAVRKVQTSR
jgi:hypothetical protein